MGYSLAYRNAGKGGERWAAAYLQSLGYRVLEANYRSRHREIDLIVEKEGILVFVEVKTRASNALLLCLSYLKSELMTLSLNSS